MKSLALSLGKKHVGSPERTLLAGRPGPTSRGMSASSPQLLPVANCQSRPRFPRPSVCLSMLGDDAGGRFANFTLFFRFSCFGQQDERPFSLQMRKVNATDKLQLRMTLRFYAAHLDTVFEVSPILLQRSVFRSFGFRNWYCSCFG